MSFFFQKRIASFVKIISYVISIIVDLSAKENYVTYNIRCDIGKLRIMFLVHVILYILNVFCYTSHVILLPLYLFLMIDLTHWFYILNHISLGIFVQISQLIVKCDFDKN